MAQITREVLVKENQWHVRFLEDEGKEAVRLFGTNELPTPWTIQVPFADVVRMLREANEKGTDGPVTFRVANGGIQ